MLRSYQFKNKTKSVTRTIRIDEDIDFQLEKLAHEQRVSVNYFANQALRKFVEWDVFADRLGFVTLPSDIFEKLVGFVTDEQAKELGGWFGKNLANTQVDIGLSEHQVFAQIVGPNEFRITMAPANAPAIAPVHPLQKP